MKSGGCLLARAHHNILSKCLCKFKLNFHHIFHNDEEVFDGGAPFPPFCGSCLVILKSESYLILCAFVFFYEMKNSEKKKGKLRLKQLGYWLQGGTVHI